MKGDADAEAEVNALSTAIKEKMAAFTKDTANDGAITNAETKAKQPLFLAYETWIADMRTNWQLTRMLLPQRMLTQLLWTVQAKWKEM